MDFKDYKIRPAELKDSKIIWEIRNHPLVRKVSGSSQSFSFDQHSSWFKDKYFKCDDNFCYILECYDKVVGYCRLDLDNKNGNYIISIAINPNYHNKGLGGLLLDQFLRKFNKIDNILAEIKKDNISSIKLFQKNNFEIISEDETKYYLRHSRQ